MQNDRPTGANAGKRRRYDRRQIDHFKRERYVCAFFTWFSPEYPFIFNERTDRNEVNFIPFLRHVLFCSFLHDSHENVTCFHNRTILAESLSTALSPETAKTRVDAADG